MNRFLLPLPIAAVVLVATCGVTLAQGAFPAPLPRQASEPLGNNNPSASAPPKNARECAKDFAVLREEVGQRSKLIKAATERKAPPVEACKLMSSYRSAEASLVRYFEDNAAIGGIPAEVTQQLKSAAAKTVAIMTEICNMARDVQQKRAPVGPTGDFWPTTNPPI